MAPAQHILDALLDVVSAGGIEAASVRSVAAAAGVSPAQVQYYFRTKDRLLVAAFEHVQRRMEQRAAAVDTTGEARQVLRRFLLTWLPLDTARRTDATVWLAFTTAAVTNAHLAPLVRETDAAVIEALAGLVVASRASGSIRAEVDPVRTAEMLLAVVDGLTVRALTHPDPHIVLPVLDDVLEQIFSRPHRK